MKKVVVSIVLLLGLLLAACGGNASSDPAKTVKALYEAGFNKDTSKMESMLVHFGGYSGYEEELAEDLYDQVAEVGGMNKLKVTTVKKSELVEEFAEGTDEYFEGNWSFVIVPFEDPTYVMGWIVQEIDGKMYVVDAEDFNTDEILAAAAEAAAEEEAAEEEEEDAAEEAVEEEQGPTPEELKEAKLEMEKELPSHQMNANMKGDWEGTYVATQGLTSMSLAFEEDDTFVFEFGPTEDNPEVPIGSYYLSASYYPESNTVRLFDGEWIDRPSGYYPLSFFGSRSNQYFNGVVEQEGKIRGHFSIVTEDDVDYDFAPIPKVLEGRKMTGTKSSDDGDIALSITFQEDNTAVLEYSATDPETQGEIVGTYVHEVNYNPTTGYLHLEGIEEVEGSSLVDLVGSINGDYFSGIIYSTQFKQYETDFKVKFQ